MVNSTVHSLTDALYCQRDPQLAREGSASFLLMIDGMIQGNPLSEDYLLSGVQAYTAYASAFAMGSDDMRAFILYDHALDYGFRLWEQRFGWNDIRSLDLETWDNTLQEAGPCDLDALYWTASAWSGWITTNPESTLAMADLSYVVKSMERVLKLDSGYQNGSAHLFFGVYYAVQPRGMGRDLTKSDSHFQEAMKLAGEDALLPKVLYARYYARGKFDEELFTRLLTEVIEAPSKSPVPELNLMNAVAKERAAQYLEQIEDLF